MKKPASKWKRRALPLTLLFASVGCVAPAATIVPETSTAANIISAPSSAPVPQGQRCNKMNPDIPVYSAGLTVFEKKDLYGIFAEDINTSIIRKHFHDCFTSAAMSVALGDGENIHIYTKHHRSSDYALETDPYLRARFIHDITHLWQFQNGVEFKEEDFKGGYDKYLYDLTPESEFDHFKPEQQAAMMQDYVLVYFYDVAPVFRDPLEPHHLLKDVVEKRFLQAGQTRQRYEAQRQTGKDIRVVMTSGHP